MPRRTNPFSIREVFHPDPEAGAAALLWLLERRATRLQAQAPASAAQDHEDSPESSHADRAAPDGRCADREAPEAGSEEDYGQD